MSLDAGECYRVRDLALPKDEARFFFTDGYLIFAKPVAGVRMSAVFTADVEGGDAQGRTVARLTDPRALRAYAHPVRMKLVGLLRTQGPLTATRAAELLGESSGTCSFHLRQLAKYGLVEEAGGGTGREKPWRATTTTTDWDATGDGSPETAAATSILSAVIAEQYFEQLARSIANSSFEIQTKANRDEIAICQPTKAALLPARSLGLPPFGRVAIQRFAAPQFHFSGRETCSTKSSFPAH